MCGIAGFLTSGQLTDLAGRAHDMASRLRHRGPDDQGVWADAAAGIALAHRRLSILDLTPAGHQPMCSPSGRYVIVFNGEIYNHLDLRCELGAEGQSCWRGHSDTETLLAGFDRWGIRETVQRATGMFAMAVWDKSERVLSLIRDRMGEKPLYYGWQGSGAGRSFLFGSELKALKAHPAFAGEIDRGALCLLLRYNAIPTPYSVYRGIAKLEPGCILSVALAKQDPEITRYWSLPLVAQEGRSNPLRLSHEEAASRLEDLLQAAIRGQMLADVPLGAFLSGGVDSSAVVALMQAQSDRPVRTFTIGFDDRDYDEAAYARAVAKHLGTDHTELYVQADQAQAVIPKLPEYYCEPFSDSSQIPTFLVSQLARQHVTVALSGDGADELFAGYNRHRVSANLWHWLARVPSPLRALLARGICAISPNAWDRMTTFIPGASRYRLFGNKLHKGAAVLASKSIDELYRGLISHHPVPERLVVGGTEPPTGSMGYGPSLDGLDAIERMMVLDSIGYLPDDILVKVDRAAMAVSLESRLPFLDHRLIEFAWSLPLEYKLRSGTTKWILRQVLYRHVPKHLIERPKTGFGVPLDAWLRGPLRDWAESLLDESRLRKEGFLMPAPIRSLWLEHLSGRRNWSQQLWDVLMFQAWLAAQ